MNLITNSQTETPSLAQHGLLNADELRAWCAQHVDKDFLVPEFLPRQPITIACGRSGEGKSPWNLQLATCLDLQIPFIGFPLAKRARSIVCSGEDFPTQTVAQIERQTRALTGQSVTPLGVLTFSGNVIPEQFNLTGLEKRIDLLRPDVVFLDPALHFFPNLERDAEAVDEAYSLLRRWEKQYGCVFVLVHHLVKSLHDNPNYRPLHAWYPDPRGWFDYARGTGALVHYADIRIGFDTSTTGTLHLGGYKRATGHLPLIWMDRILDEDGNPMAYSRMCDEALLTAAKRAVFQKLPAQFTPADVKALPGWQNDSKVHPFLDELKNLGLVTQDGRRQPYVKVAKATNPSSENLVEPASVGRRLRNFRGVSGEE